MDKKNRQALERALCALIDNEVDVRDALIKKGRNTGALSDVLDALRLLVDGD